MNARNERRPLDDWADRMRERGVEIKRAAVGGGMPLPDATLGLSRARPSLLQRLRQPGSLRRLFRGLRNALVP